MSGPGFSQDLRQRQTQSLVLAPQLRQSLKILQVAALDLRSVIQEELQSNPTLEELPMKDVSLEQPDASPDKESDGAGEGEDNGDPRSASAESDDEPRRDELDFSKDREFEILGKLDEELA
jgi:RNA polymerase sigma-54 factor